MSTPALQCHHRPLCPKDVREPEEVIQGSIPSSVSLPLSKLEKQLDSDEGDFTRVNGFHKPTKDQKIM